jgi:hypothetical protein
MPPERLATTSRIGMSIVRMTFLTDLGHKFGLRHLRRHWAPGTNQRPDRED